MGIEGEPKMPDPTPENVEQTLKDVEKATLEVEAREAEKVPNYGLGEYDAPISKAIQNIEDIHKKNQRSAREIAGMLGQILKSIPPKKSEQIFRKVYADTLKNPRPFIPELENEGESVPKHWPPATAEPTTKPLPEVLKNQKETENEEKNFIKKQRECLVYIDELARTKNVSLLPIRENVNNIHYGDTEKIKYILWQLNDAVTITKRLTQKEANTIAEILGI